MESLIIILNSARDAFLQVGVWVALTLLIFGYLEYKTGGKIISNLREYRKWQPVMGAAFGVMPGCGGAIFVMPLFVNRTVSFGTVVATLIATVGDSSWILIVAAPKQALLIHAITFLTGVVTGYIVDALKIGSNLVAKDQVVDAPVSTPQGFPHALDLIEHIEGVKPMKRLHVPSHIHPERWSYRFTHHSYILLWGVFLIGFIASFPVQMQILTTEKFNALFGGVPIYDVVGVIGALFCLFWMALSHKFMADDTHEEVEEKLQSRREMLIHSGAEIASVTVWVTIAFALFELFMYFTGVDLKVVVDRSGILAVVAAALVGLIPGCGPQVILNSLYIKGAIPFPAVVANAISQDGDALFPLLALHPRAALLATIITTIPALVVGAVFYFVV